MWPGADAGSSVLLEWIHALVAGLAGAIYREHKPAELRSAGQRGQLSPRGPSWLQHEHGSSTSEDARACITLLFAQTSCTVGDAVCRIPCLGGGFVSNLMFSKDRFRRLLRRHLIASVGNGGLDCRYALAPDLRRASLGQPAGPLPLRRPLNMVVGAVCPCLRH